MQGVPIASALTSWVVTPQALLWRNWKLKKRSWASTVVELLSPIVLVGLLVSNCADAAALDTSVLPRIHVPKDDMDATT